MEHELDQHGVSRDDRIDAACDAFESVWLSGERPSVEAFLERAQPDDRRALFAELLLLDHEYCRRSKQPWRSDEYLRGFPDYAGEIEALGFVGHWDDTVVEDRKDAAPAPAAKRRFSRFELIEKVGAGAFGEVWKARDSRLQRIVALKIPRGVNLDDRDLQRFLREARAAAQLRHAHIVSVYEAGREGSDAYIVSDFIDGETLRERLKRGPLTAEAAAQLCASLADALHYAHTAGIVHRDVKPANVLLDAQLRPHLADFGLATWSADVQELTLTGQLIGTPSYMSPEQAAGAKDRVDGRSDVFSLGVMLYEMLVGQCPFRGDQAATVRAILESEPARPRSHDRRIPRDLETICLKALEKDPNRRYATAQAMATDLRRFMRGEPILARRAGPLRKAWKLALRRPAVVAAAVLLVVAVSATTLAARTARQNRQLQGYRTVTIETEPRGARVAFVPLDKSTGEPDAKQAVRAGDDDTIIAELKPGDYFVVAALPDGRFHEVYRHVPDPQEMVPASLRHRRWSMQEDGSIRLPKITIPSWKVDETMAFLPGSNAFQSGESGSGQAPRQVRSVAPFYMDAHEFTVADAPFAVAELKPQSTTSFPERRPGDSVSVPFDWAVEYAEQKGKRLPTAEEYEIAATNGGTSQYPWGNELEELTPIGFEAAPYDRHAVDSRLRGLCSGKAEWTMSWQPDFAGHTSGDPQRWRVIRGGNHATAAGDPSVTAESRDPRKAYYVERDRTLPGLGFRCVRSAAPLLSYDQMQ